MLRGIFMRIASRFLWMVLLASSACLFGQASKQPDTPSSQQQSPDAGEYARGFKAGLAQHQELLQETRDQIVQVQKEIDKAKFANEAFIAFYTLVTALLLGEGFLSLHRQKSRGKELEAQAGLATTNASQAAAEAKVAAGDAGQLVANAKAELDKITAARKDLFSELGAYLRQTIEATTALDPDTFDVFQQALVNEIDHITFLGSAAFHLRKPENTDELNSYCEGLLFTVRGHLLRSRPAEALKRIDMFFKLTKAPNHAKDSDRARMYGYRASAFMELLSRAIAEPAASRKPRDVEKIRRYRNEISDGLLKAKNLDATWSGLYYHEAYFHSLFPVPPDVTDPARRTALMISGQERALELYRRLIQEHDKLRPNMVGVARWNICCCLKRLADQSGSYQELFKELQGFPRESEIRDRNIHDGNSIDHTSENLWSSLMQDDVFFAKDPTQPLTAAAYKSQWVTILDQKADLEPWRDRCAHYRASNKQMNSWKIKVWEP
jgi:hypothetical protein